MVAGSRDKINSFFDFDQVAETAQASLEAGRRLQESWLETLTQSTGEDQANRFFANGQQVAKAWFPFVGQAMNTAAKTLEDCFQAGLKVVKTGGEAMANAGKHDVCDNVCGIWDAGLDTCRSQMDMLRKSGEQAMQNWTAFCKAGMGGTKQSKTAPKNGK